jgi:hypothetical protein
LGLAIAAPYASQNQSTLMFGGLDHVAPSGDFSALEFLEPILVDNPAELFGF